MRIHTRIEDDLTIITVTGEFVGELVTRFTKAVSEALEAGRLDFLIDLSEAQALDSSALEVLTALQRRTQDQLGMLHLCVTDATIRKLFEITRLDRQLSIHGSSDEARCAFGADFAGKPSGETARAYAQTAPLGAGE